MPGEVACSLLVGLRVGERRFGPRELLARQIKRVLDGDPLAALVRERAVEFCDPACRHRGGRLFSATTDHAAILAAGNSRSYSRRTTP